MALNTPDATELTREQVATILTKPLEQASVFLAAGPRVFDTTGDIPKKIYRGQQLVIFGRYEIAGRSTVTLHASLTGEEEDAPCRLTAAAGPPSRPCC